MSETYLSDVVESGTSIGDVAETIGVGGAAIVTVEAID